MKGLLRDFVSQEKRDFRFMIGSIVASSLSGFLAGVVFASIIWYVGLLLFKSAQ